MDKLQKEKKILITPNPLCPSVAWFTTLQDQLYYCKMVLQHATRLASYDTAKNTTVELEARIGTIHPETQDFVPGILMQDAQRLFAAHFSTTATCDTNKKSKWEQLNDVYYEHGLRWRNQGALIKKKKLHQCTFLCRNGFAFRIGIALEEKLNAASTTQPMEVVGVVDKGKEMYRRSRLRASLFDDTQSWRYDLSTDAGTNKKLMEVEIESQNGNNNIWQLAYRSCHLIQALSKQSETTSKQSEMNSKQSETTSWSNKCDLWLEGDVCWPMETFLHSSSSIPATSSTSSSSSTT